MRYLRAGISTLLMMGLLSQGTSSRVPALVPVADQKRAELSEFFGKYVGLSDDQIGAIGSGKSVAKILDPPTADEVFVFGAVYVRATPEEYLKLASDTEALKKLPNYLAIRKFSDPPLLSDLDGFSLEEDDLKALQKCREGKCEVQLPTDAMDEFRAKVNRSAPDASDQANKIAKELVLESLKRYQQGGNAGLGIYRDKNDPAAVGHAFQSLVSRENDRREATRESRDYLPKYPEA